jgi:hypothetical protein
LLIEPGLFHYEMGWPNMLRWSGKIGDLQVEMRGGFIFRVTKQELVIGSSYTARASLTIKAEFDQGIVGCRISAVAEIAYGARFIGVVSLQGLSNSAIYGAIGIEAQIRFSIEFWLRIKLAFIKFTKTYRFSLTIGFTASLEMGLMGIEKPGLRGTGTVSVSFMGHSLQLNARLGVNESTVKNALERTSSYLQLGLEATEVEKLPGTSADLNLVPRGAVIPPRAREAATQRGAASGSSAVESSSAPDFKSPNYTIFVIRDPGNQASSNPEEGWSYFILLPEGPEESKDPSAVGFLPAPPGDQVQHSTQYTCDFKVDLPGLESDFELMHFNPNGNPNGSGWVTVDDQKLSWKANWDAKILDPNTAARYPESEQVTPSPSEASDQAVPQLLKQYLCYAFKTRSNADGDLLVPIGDPTPLPRVTTLIDDRVQNPTDSAYEAAVRGAVAQFRSSPFFKPDPNLEYDQVLTAAFQDDTTIYSPSGKVSRCTSYGA